MGGFFELFLEAFDFFVKIDQAFVCDLHRSNDCRLIIQSITDLAHGLGRIATAEGVETVEQLRLVHEIGCDFVQGYLISPPMPPEVLGGWITEFRHRWPAMLAHEELALWRDVELNSLS